MDWPRIKSTVISSVEDLLTERGYKFVKSQESFERKSGNETRMVFFGFVAKKDAIHSMRMWCGIKNTAIEKIFHRTSGVDKRFRRNYTVVNRGMDDYLNVTTRSEVTLASRRGRQFLDEEAIPFLEREYTVAGYSRLLNSQPEEHCPYHANSENRCHYGLICAKLAGDPTYAAAKAVYESFLKNTNNGFYLPRFLSFVSDLESPDEIPPP